MSGIRFAWDEAKNTRNRLRHGVRFEEALEAFFDEHAMLMYDPDHSRSEDRYLILGGGFGSRLLVVSHSYRADDEVIRIISARRATRRERAQYESGIPQ